MLEHSLPRSLAGHLRVNNLALAVGDLAHMVAWYGSVLGFVVVERGRFDAVGADYAMLEGAGICLELVSRPQAPQRPVDRTTPPDHLGTLGWKALVLETQDLVAATAILVRHQVEMLWENQVLSPERRSTMIRDPEGNLIHLFGPRQPITA